MSQTHRHLKKIKAYSILELLVTLAIFGMLSVALTQSLLQNITFSAEITARSQIRSALDEAMTLIQRDFRNANDVDITTCTASPGTVSYLTVAGTVSCLQACGLKDNNDTRVSWCFDNTGKDIRRMVQTDVATNTWKTDYQSPALLDVQQLNFAVNTSNSSVTDFTPYANILVTLQAQNVPLNILNQVKQISITTRNYNIE